MTSFIDALKNFDFTTAELANNVNISLGNGNNEITVLADDSNGGEINFQNQHIGCFPACDFIGEIFQNLDSLSILNLRNNGIYSEGLKKIIDPIFKEEDHILITLILNV